MNVEWDRGTVRIAFSSPKHASVAFQTLKPETRTPSSNRSKVRIELKGNVLTLDFEARDTSGLRASMNSYLRWVLTIRDTCTVIEGVQ